MRKVEQGFALLLVLWALMMMSTIALSMAASVAAETRTAQQSWDDLQTELLASSGHQVTTYLETRAFGTASENFNGLPVQALTPGLSYRVTFNTGTVDVILEGENQKIDLAAGGEERTAAFFAFWTGDANRGREIGASIADWVDPDDTPRAAGAESVAYSGKGYLPRNGPFSSADLLLIKGFTPADFTFRLAGEQGLPQVREPVFRFIAAVPGSSGGRLNPNYASRAILQTVPGMTSSVLQRILDLRRQAPFTSLKDFQSRTGLDGNSSLSSEFVFDRGQIPAVSVIAHLQNSASMRVERRAYSFSSNVRVVALVERNLPSP